MISTVAGGSWKAAGGSVQSELVKLLNVRSFQILLGLIFLGPATLGPLLAFLATLVPRLVILNKLGPITYIETLTVFEIPVAVASFVVGFSLMRFERVGAVFARSRLTTGSPSRILFTKLVVALSASALASFLGLSMSTFISGWILSIGHVETIPVSHRLALAAVQSLVAGLSATLGVCIPTISKTLNGAAFHGLFAFLLLPVILLVFKPFSWGTLSDFTPVAAIQGVVQMPGATVYSFGPIPKSSLSSAWCLAVFLVWLFIYVAIASHLLLKFDSVSAGKEGFKVIQSYASTKLPSLSLRRLVVGEILSAGRSRIFLISIMLCMVLVVLLPAISPLPVFTSLDGLDPANSQIMQEAGIGRFLCAGIWSASLLVGFAAQSLFSERLSNRSLRRELIGVPSRRLLLTGKLLALVALVSATSLICGIVGLALTYWTHQEAFTDRAVFWSAAGFFLSRLFLVQLASGVLGFALGVIFRNPGLATVAFIFVTQGFILGCGLIEIGLGSVLATDILRTTSNVFPYVDGTLIYYPGEPMAEVCPGAVINVLTLSPDHKLLVLWMWSLILMAVAFKRFRRQRY